MKNKETENMKHKMQLEINLINNVTFQVHIVNMHYIDLIMFYYTVMKLKYRQMPDNITQVHYY